MQCIKPVEKQPEIKPEERSRLYEFTKFAESLNKVAKGYREDKEIVTVNSKEKKPKKTYKLGGERITDEVLDNRIIDYIKKHQPCNLVWDKKTGTFPEKFLNHLKIYNNARVRRHLIRLADEKKILRNRGEFSGIGRAPFTYTVIEDNTELTPAEMVEILEKSEKKNKTKEEFEKEIKINNEKALQQIKNTRKLQKTTEDLKEIEEYMDFMEDREQEEEDMRVRDTAIEVLSPERSKKRQIKRKCKKCGNSLLPMNTRDDSLTSKSLTIETDNPVDYWHCITCAESYFKEEEVLAA